MSKKICAAIVMAVGVLAIIGIIKVAKEKEE